MYEFLRELMQSRAGKQISHKTRVRETRTSTEAAFKVTTTVPQLLT